MNWENMLDQSAYWCKYLFFGYCVAHTVLDVSNLPTSSAVLVVGSAAVVVADWVNKQRK